MKPQTEPGKVWAEYEKAKRYKESIGLYANVESYEAFYSDDQWRGLHAPDLPKVQLNFLRRVVSSCVAKVVSDDFSASFTPFEASEENAGAAALLTKETEKAAELTDLRRVHKENVRNAAVDGDTANYFWFDPDAPGGGQIRCETVENTAVCFGDPYKASVQEQPYILLSLRQPAGDVKAEALRNGVPAEEADRILPDADAVLPGLDGEDCLTTVLLKLYREDGKIRCLKCTQRSRVRPPFDTGLTLYPVAWMSWERVRRSCHGRSAVAGMLPNQIALNKAYSGILKQVMSSGFPTLFYNRQFVDRWDGRPGRAVAVQGNFDPSRAAYYLTAPGVDSSITNVLDSLVTMTKEFMGASDVTLGTAKADNASAILALQNADAVPMELHRQEFYGFVEQEMRILADLVRACYGVRQVMTGNGTALFDFSTLPGQWRLRVDIGAASYWSESVQTETLEALFRSGIMNDPELFGLYLEVMPDKFLPGKDRLRAFNERQKQRRENDRNGGNDEQNCERNGGYHGEELRGSGTGTGRNAAGGAGEQAGN